MSDKPDNSGGQSQQGMAMVFQQGMDLIDQFPEEIRLQEDYQPTARDVLAAQLMTQLWENPLDGLQAQIYMLRTCLEMGRNHFLGATVEKKPN